MFEILPTAADVSGKQIALMERVLPEVDRQIFLSR